MKTKKIVICLGILFLVQACETPQAPAPLAPRVIETVKSLPSDGSLVAFLDVAALRSSEIGSFFYENHFNALKEIPQYQLFTEVLGIDPVEQIDDIYWTIKKDIDPEHGFFLIAHGSFDLETLFSSLKINSPHLNLNREEKNGHLYYQIKFQNFQFLVIDKKVLVTGQLSDVNAWEQQYTGSKQNRDDNPMRERIDALNRLMYNSGFWIWADPQAIELDVPVDAVNNIVLGAEFARRLNIHSRMACKDKEAAESLSQAIKGMLATIKLSATDDRQFVDTINEIDIQVNEKNIDLKGDFSLQEVQLVLEHRGVKTGEALD